MLFLRKPTPDILRRFVAGQSSLPFTYAEVGATAGELPAGYMVDRTRISLGAGERVYRTAVAALRNWVQFRLSWVEAWPPDTPIQAHAVVAVVGRAVGFWWVNACRIVYVLDESGPMTKYGFAYGTLPGHAARGEERFLIEWDRSDDRVYYDILAFSRPNHLLTRLGYPLVRRLQKRFGRHSGQSMVSACQL